MACCLTASEISETMRSSNNRIQPFGSGVCSANGIENGDFGELIINLNSMNRWFGHGIDYLVDRFRP